MTVASMAWQAPIHTHFGGPRRALPSNGILVADGNRTQVVRFNKTASISASWQAGSGPGEFLEVHTLRSMPAGESTR